MSDAESTGLELAKSDERSFRRSNQSFMNRVAGKQQEDTATYSPDKIFYGWIMFRGSEYEELWQKLWNSGRYGTVNEAKQRAIQLMAEKIREWERQDEMYLDRGSANIIFHPGERGSAKSWDLRKISNRESVGGVLTVLFDIKGEYHTNNRGGSKKYGIQKHLMNLRREEQPQKVPTKVLTPMHVKRARDEQEDSLPGRDEDWHDLFSFGFEDLTPDDYAYILQQAVDEDKKRLVHSLTFAFQKEIREGWLPSRWQDVFDKIREFDEKKDIFQWHKRADIMIEFLKLNYKEYDVISPRRKVDWEDVFNEYNCVALNLATGGDFFPDDVDLNPLYISLMVKKVRQMKKQGKIDSAVDFVVDEAHNPIPADTGSKHPPSKRQLRKAIKEDRSLGFRATLASQEPTDVQDENFLGQCRYFILPWNLKPQRQRFLLLKTNFTDQNDFSRGLWRKVFKAMPRYSKLVVDMDRSEWFVCESASPLANHLEE